MTDKLAQAKEANGKFQDQFKLLVGIGQDAGNLSEACSQLFCRVSMIHPQDKKTVRMLAFSAFIQTLQLDGDLESAIEEIGKEMDKMLKAKKKRKK